MKFFKCFLPILIMTLAGCSPEAPLEKACRLREQALANRATTLAYGGWVAKANGSISEYNAFISLHQFSGFERIEFLDFNSKGRNEAR